MSEAQDSPFYEHLVVIETLREYLDFLATPEGLEIFKDEPDALTDMLVLSTAITIRTAPLNQRAELIDRFTETIHTNQLAFSTFLVLMKIFKIKWREGQTDEDFE